MRRQRVSVSERRWRVREIEVLVAALAVLAALAVAAVGALLWLAK